MPNFDAALAAHTAQSPLVNSSTKPAVKRRRVTALLSQRQFEHLEELASTSGQPTSTVAAMILGFVLDQDDKFTASTNADKLEQ